MHFPATEELIQVPLDQIRVNPFQPRRAFDKSELDELAQSIVAVGLIHPPTVRRLGKESYELVSGERRFRASQLAGLTCIPVVVRATNNSLSAQAALIENVQRVDLNPIEIAKALRSLMEEFGLGQDELSLRIGKKRSTIANYFRLLSLPQVIQESVHNEAITMGHAKAILALEGFEKQALLHDLILRDHLSVREAEEGALRIADKAKRKALVYETRDFFLEQLAEKIQQRLGTKVTIQGRGKKGKITIDYYNLDDLDRILDYLQVHD